MAIDHTFPPKERADELLDGLDAAQRAAVTSDAHPLCIVAGAGSGKTRVLTRRIAHRIATGSALAGHVLALTFTRRAAAELGRRLSALGGRERVAAGTFHGLAYAQLRRRWSDLGDRPPVLLEHKARVLRALVPTDAPVADLATEIEWAKARMVEPSRYSEAVVAAGRRPPLRAAVVAEAYARYEHEKRRRHLVDFDDLVLLCAEALEADAEFAATQRWRFRHLFVDEFQDVNPAQFRLLEAWRGGRSDLCVVGDPDQAIYAWNGADPSFVSAFAAGLPADHVVHLDRNYRSSAQVVAVANSVLCGHRAPAAHDLRPARGNGAVPRVVAYATDREEAVGVTRALRQQHGTGRAWSELAVLARTRAQLVLFEEALHAAAVPCRVRGAVGFLDRPEVAGALAELRRRPPTDPLGTALTDLRLAAGGLPPEHRTDESAVAEQRAHLDELARMMVEALTADPAMSVSAFLAWVQATLRDEEPAPGADAVELVTFHGAKGLEWPVVFLVGLEQGLVPVAHANTPEARREERRLLYVAITRARDDLHCSWAERRAFAGTPLARAPSPWLALVEAAVSPLNEPEPDAQWRGHLAESRARVRAGDASDLRRRPLVELGERADPAVLSALRSWRAGAARAAGVPAFVVLHDSTLAAVAEACPTDRRALLALPGMGPVRAERYGDDLLALVAGARGS